MAIRDFKEYLYGVQKHYSEAKADLVDFDEALKNGFMSENQVQYAKDDFALIDANYQRLLYVDFLLNMPSRKRKKYMRRKKVRATLKQAKLNKADAKSVLEETENTKSKLRDELEKLKKEDKRD